MYDYEIVTGRLYKPFEDVFRTDSEAGSVDTWMAAYIFSVDHFVINEQLYFVVCVVYKPHDTRRTRCTAYKLFHVFRFSKVQS